MYQRKVDVDMLNTVKSVLAEVSSVSPSSEQRKLSSYDFRLRSCSIGNDHFKLNRFWLMWLKCTNRTHFNRFGLKTGDSGHQTPTVLNKMAFGEIGDFRVASVSKRVQVRSLSYGN